MATFVGTGSNEHVSLSMFTDQKNLNRDAGAAFESSEQLDQEQQML